MVVLEMGSKISVMHLYTNKSAEKWRDGTPEMLKEKQEEKKIIIIIIWAKIGISMAERTTKVKEIV